MSPDTYVIDKGKLMILLNEKRTTSVVITCAGYTHYLKQAIDSLKRQIIGPDEIIVVFDNTSLPPQQDGIKYLRVNYGSPFLSRKRGFEEARSEVIIFLDADDYLSDDYIAQGLSIKTDNNIIYSDMQLFGDLDKLVEYPSFIPSKRISQVNFLHIGCLVSADTIRQSKAFSSLPPPTCHEDWVFWRRLVRYGYQYQKQSGIYYARQHDNNRSCDIESGPYYEAKGIAADIIAFIKIDGGQHARAVIDQWPDKQRQLVCNEYQDFVCERMIIYNGNPIEAVRSLTADYVYFYDSNSTHIDIQQLLREFNHDVAAVHCQKHEFWHATMAVIDIIKERPTGGPLCSKKNEQILLLKTTSVPSSL